MKSMTATALTALLAVAVAGCASPARTQASPGHPGGPATAAANASVSYTLYTHCGIRFAKIGGRWFEADRPLSDGSGNPPPGWGNPEAVAELGYRSRQHPDGARLRTGTWCDFTWSIRALARASRSRCAPDRQAAYIAGAASFGRLRWYSHPATA